MGLLAEVVTVEVDISNGLNAMSIVGLGDRAVEEAKDRISAAIKNSGFVSPKQKNQKVIISLAPADIRKEGPSFDLPMAVAYLAATGDIQLDPAGTIFLGELSLDGNIRKVTGLLPILCELRSKGFHTAYVPNENREEASLAEGMEIYAVRSLIELISSLKGQVGMTRVQARRYEPSLHQEEGGGIYNMKLIKGNRVAKRALEIAAAGGHNMLMYGPPGTGKTLLARTFPTLLPPLSHEECVEVTGIYSAAHALTEGFMTQPPFRAPHHTSSYSALIGGGNIPKPGEITLAHRGVLFLDELPEFGRQTIEALREPLEERHITIARARGALTFPAHCILIGSMNPCPCGKLKEDCTCTPWRLISYRRRISGPILDRFDLWVNVDKIEYDKMISKHDTEEDSETIRQRVVSARAIQAQRFTSINIRKRLNSELSARDIAICSPMENTASNILEQASRKLKLSGRGLHRIIKIARTIADLSGSDIIKKPHMLEALHYRQKVDW